MACQGGGIHGAFTCGVLNRLLKAKEDEENGIADTRSRRRFEISGLSGTSAGALNAFMVWYGMMLKDGQKGGAAAARQAVNNLWDTFQVRKSGEWGINLLGQQAYRRTLKRLKGGTVLATKRAHSEQLEGFCCRNSRTAVRGGAVRLIR